ncbi:pimeloyl-ACP methyl ester carboxylesterase [Tamaricihabitans halophyticus]|uniref:Pimeloyl-ACP methyl ester carboxylesterase n=1 Tax=Tamaricihabitans halophyticus TaxID=1262583 RepID=A0A4R2R3V0_9PSEU|nr:alpha/beta hydrolase [Tamaricihabitans halophyticus]TCP57522.1 pimeloyl-ACP methyl ester carboxylesterase [Tamaricihabitans halophyticus]
MHRVQFPENEISYRDTGTGPPLVLVHGHPFDGSMWQPQIDYFSARGWRVIVPDLRGYGGSEVIPGETPLETFAADILRLLDELRLDQVVLGGLSMGGQIVLACYRQFPERLRGLLLADTSARADTAEGKAARIALAERLTRSGIGDYATEVLPKMVCPATITDRPEVANRVLDMMRAAPAEGAAAALRGRAQRPDYLSLLPTIAVPTLVVVGSADEFTPVSEAEVLHREIPEARLVIVPETGHLPNMERPTEFNAALSEFLEGFA